MLQNLAEGMTTDIIKQQGGEKSSRQPSSQLTGTTYPYIMYAHYTDNTVTKDAPQRSQTIGFGHHYSLPPAN
jgi:hypothetical protein